MLKGVPGEWRLYAVSGEPPTLPVERFRERPRQARLRRVLSLSVRHRVPPAFAALALGFLLGLGVLFAWLRSDGAGHPPGRKVLAVLPFENVGAAEDEYFADGMTDEVRGKLAALPGLEVIASQSSAEYKKSPKSLAQIGQKLRAHYLVVGKVRWEKAGGQSRVRVSPELVEVASGRAPTTKWQEPFDAALTNVFRCRARSPGASPGNSAWRSGASSGRRWRPSPPRTSPPMMPTSRGRLPLRVWAWPTPRRCAGR